MDTESLDYDDLYRILMLIDSLPHMAEIDVRYRALEVHVEREDVPQAPLDAAP